MRRMREIVATLPVIGAPMRRLYRRWANHARQRTASFPGSRQYWEQRYATGGDSGVGSYSFFAAFKAEVLNDFVARNRIRSVIEFGCGDGNQLRLANYPAYLGLDVSETAIEKCRTLFASDPTKAFRTMAGYDGSKAELSMSLDVIFHLVEDAVFERYMRELFDAGQRYVVIYASDMDRDEPGAEHVRHRKFTDWVAANIVGWSLQERIPNRYPYHGDYRTGSFADFFIYARR